jgi:tRNA(fMet)-specific endonuclease VapC
MRYLLDTDTCIHALKSFNPSLIAKLTAHEGELATSTIVAHELYFGAEKYAEPQRRLFLVEQFLLRLRLIPFDQATARVAGTLRNTLRQKGGNIGSYDVLIAATALVHDLTLVSGNTREFSRVPKLRSRAGPPPAHRAIAGKAPFSPNFVGGVRRSREGVFRQARCNM